MIPAFPVYLFDVDGTLLDSAPDICGTIRETLAGTAKQHLDDRHLRRYIGYHLLDMYTDLFPDAAMEWIEERMEHYRALYPARNHTMTRVFPGVREGLSALGGKKSTATTKKSETVKVVFDLFGLSGFFDHVQGTDGFPAKPEPDVVFAALKGLGARPEECLLVGDAPPDMEAGRRAGVKICAVRYGYGDPTELAKWRPDYWIDDLRQLAQPGVRTAVNP